MNEASHVEDTSLLTDGYLLGAENPTIPISYVQPKYTSLLLMPKVENSDIRNCVHTDTMKEVLLFLSKLEPETLNALKIEGRVLNRSQWEQLENDHIYRFYMNGRADRADARVQRYFLKYTIPASLQMNEAEVNRLVHTAYSPESSEATIGYRVGFYDAAFLAHLWTNKDILTPNSLIPLLGGCNRFRIGSDTLGQDIHQITQRLRQHITVVDNTIAASATIVPAMGQLSSVSTFQIKN